MQSERLIVGLLLIVSLVAVAVRRWRLPYTVALVGAGLAVSLWQPVQISVVPELILTLFVPPLVFEAAFHLDLQEVRRNLPVLLLLAVPGVVLTTLVVGGLLAVATPLGLPLAFVFGSLVAATDPVAVLAIFRRLGVPKRLSVLLEGESLFNDGTAIAVFGLALAAAIGGGPGLAGSVGRFLIVSAGGVVVGLCLGLLASYLISQIDDYLIETTLTTVLAFGAYLVAEELHLSGVLAVVAAGLVNGNLCAGSTYSTGAACAAPSAWRWPSASPPAWELAEICCRRWPLAWCFLPCWCRRPLWARYCGGCASSPMARCGRTMS